MPKLRKRKNPALRFKDSERIESPSFNYLRAMNLSQKYKKTDMRTGFYGES